ncbi:MAG: energy transducer TonB [Tannerella sp.]|nr:energy transducer TonB [Tannerella sp.]
MWLKILPAIALTICLLAAHTGYTQVNTKQDVPIRNTATAVDDTTKNNAATQSKTPKAKTTLDEITVVGYGTSSIGENKDEMVVVGYGTNKTTETTGETFEGVVFEDVEELPEFPGGYPALIQFLWDNINYPVIAQENGIQGKVTAKFVITDDGSIAGITIVKGPDPSLDKEMVRLIKAMPQWTPGKQNGQPVNVRYTLPVNFVLKKAK